MASDADDLSRLIVELAGRIDQNDRAILKKLDEILMELADIRAGVDALIPEGPPEEEEEEES